MQPVKLIVPGDYWDSQIYRGRLYLWDMSAVLRVYDWDGLVKDLPERQKHGLALDCAFARGDILYHPGQLGVVLKEADVKSLLQSKFDSAAEINWQVDKSELQKHLLSEQDDPTKGLHDDCLIYNSTLFSLTDVGLFSVLAHRPRKQKTMVSRQAHKIWDGSGLGLQIGNGLIAIAAADEGLFEYNINLDREPERLSELHTEFASYLFASVFGSSSQSPSYLAAFYWQDLNKQRQVVLEETGLSTIERLKDRIRVPRSGPKVLERKFDRFVASEAIFGNPEILGRNLSIGRQEKIYRVSRQKIEAVNFVQKAVSDPESDQEPFTPIGEIPLAPEAGDDRPPLAGAVAYFGIVLEFDEGVLVITSDGELHRLPGSATRWRVFPRSHRYENHLHIIGESNLQVMSFNNDYFVDQFVKKAGMRFKSDFGFRV
jgi:hypothetical protein